MFSEKSPLSNLLRQRPAVIELLEASRQPFWNCTEMPAEQFCREAGIDLQNLLRMAESPPVIPPNADWKEQRTYSIVDFLTADHRRFREKDLPAFHELLERHAADESDSCGVKFVSETFKSFKDAFLEHLKEEEEHVFPSLLRMEAICGFLKDRKTRAPKRKPANGSEPPKNAYEEHLDRLALDAGRFFNDDMRDFRRRLIRHSKMETEILFPRVKLMEMKLAMQPKVFRLLDKFVPRTLQGEMQPLLSARF